MSSEIIVGIIGGTGLDQDPDLLSTKTFVDISETPYGKPSDDQAIKGEIEGVTVYIISRHGKNHDVNPSSVNYRANLWALARKLNCSHILVTSACGSLKEEIAPGHVGILSQYIDRTKGKRLDTFYRVCHVEQRDPVDKTMRRFIAEACQELDIKCHKDLTCVSIEGPRFSTLAESNWYRSMGCDIINMTAVPEIPLATELSVFYASILLVTDYDCWKEGEDCVSADKVVERMKELGSKARRIIPVVIKKIKGHDWSAQKADNLRRLEGAIMAP